MCQDGKDVYDLAVERRTIRRFKPEPVPPGFLERLVNAARLAPSAANVIRCAAPPFIAGCG